MARLEKPGTRAFDDTLYPPSPRGVPPLGKPTSAYRLRVVLVLVSLVLFVALYLGLVAASGYLVYWTWNLPTPRGKGALLKFGSVVGAAMLFLFFLKGLFKRQRVDLVHGFETRLE